MKNQKNLFLLIIICFGINVANAQTGNIKGKVKTSDLNPAIGVKIILKNSNYSGLVDQNGVFEINEVNVGTYTLQTLYAGLKSKEVEIVVKSNETILLKDIIMEENTQYLNEITVLQTKELNSSEYVSKMPLKNLENAQVYSVIDKKIIESQQINNVESAMKNATGVSIVFPATGRATDGGTYYTTRGFTTSASLMNGIAGTVMSNPDAVYVERIEILKGPSATLFGSSLTSFGGAINIITKRPYEKLGGTIGLNIGSWNLQRLTFDFNSPLNEAKTVLFRINGAIHSQNSFQDYGFNKRQSFSPSLSYKVNEKLSFLLESNFSNIEATLDPWFYADSATTGVTSVDKLNLHYNKYYFPGDITMTTKSANVLGQMKYKFSEKWTSQTIISSSVNDSKGAGTYLWFISDTSLTRENQKFEGTTNQLNLQQNFTGDFKIFGKRNRLVAGVDYYQNKQNSTYQWLSGLQDTVFTNQANANYMDYNLNKMNNSTPFYFFGSYTGIQQTERVGAYLSNVLNVTDNLLINIGARYDYFVSKGYSDPIADTLIGAFEQGGFSPKLGVVYQVMKNKIALFANFQNSFQNVNGRDFEGNVFIPQRANQLEGGFKFSLLKDKMSGTISYYDISVTNTLRNDVLHPNFSIQDGTQKSKGFEAEVNIVAAKGLNILIGYAHNNNKYVKADSSVLGRRPVEAGPQDLANFWVSYQIETGKVKGLGIGFGGNYASKKFTNNDALTGEFYIPSYTVLNAGLFYTKEKYSLKLNVNNLTNQKYWVGWNNLVSQKPREILLSATWNF
jgi:iron complex outermembrane receptor protein